MEILSLSLILLGTLIGFFYGIVLLIIAFKKSILWGLAYMFVPFASIVFVFMYWDDCKSPVLRSLLAIPLIFCGVFLHPQSMGLLESLQTYR